MIKSFTHKGLKEFSPPHPGEILNALCLEPLRLSITDAAAGLGVTRKTLSELVNGHTGVSPLMAIRLSKAFGGSPDSWLTHQLEYDLWHAQKTAKKLKIKNFRQFS